MKISYYVKSCIRSILKTLKNVSAIAAKKELLEYQESEVFAVQRLASVIYILWCAYFIFSYISSFSFHVNYNRIGELFVRPLVLILPLPVPPLPFPVFLLNIIFWLAIVCLIFIYKSWSIQGVKRLLNAFVKDLRPLLSLIFSFSSSCLSMSIQWIQELGHLLLFQKDRSKVVTHFRGISRKVLLTLILCGALIGSVALSFTEQAGFKLPFFKTDSNDYQGTGFSLESLESMCKLGELSYMTGNKAGANLERSGYMENTLYGRQLLGNMTRKQYMKAEQWYRKNCLKAW